MIDCEVCKQMYRDGLTLPIICRHEKEKEKK